MKMIDMLELCFICYGVDKNNYKIKFMVFLF